MGIDLYSSINNVEGAVNTLSAIDKYEIYNRHLFDTIWFVNAFLDSGQLIRLGNMIDYTYLIAVKGFVDCCLIEVFRQLDDQVRIDTQRR